MNPDGTIKPPTKELLEKAKEQLKAKVKLEFVIGSAGRVVVAQVTESTLNDNAVESCLARRMQRTQFPRPKGGGTVVVRYPFLFKST